MHVNIKLFFTVGLFLIKGVDFNGYQLCAKQPQYQVELKDTREEHERGGVALAPGERKKLEILKQGCSMKLGLDWQLKHRHRSAKTFFSFLRGAKRHSYSNLLDNEF